MSVLCTATQQGVDAVDWLARFARALDLAVVPLFIRDRRSSTVGHSRLKLRRAPATQVRLVSAAVRRWSRKRASPKAKMPLSAATSP